MAPSELNALSPLDGRYAGKLAALRGLCSEAGLIRQRVRVEAQWYLHLAGERLPIPASISQPVRDELSRLASAAAPDEATRVKELEASINHDVKAVEYYVRE